MVGPHPDAIQTQGLIVMPLPSPRDFYLIPVALLDTLRDQHLILVPLPGTLRKRVLILVPLPGTLRNWDVILMPLPGTPKLRPFGKFVRSQRVLTSSIKFVKGCQRVFAILSEIPLSVWKTF
jgi:hypothetical protein